jgi:hypothetical protein
VSPKERGILSSACTSPLLDIHRLLCIFETFIKLEWFYFKYCFSFKILKTLKFYCFNFMDHKGSIVHLDFLSRSQQVVHVKWQFIPNNRIPTEMNSTISTWFHPKDWTKIQGRICECNQFYSPLSPRSQNLQSFHNATSIILRTKHILYSVLNPQKNIKHELPHTHSKNPT